MIIFIKESLQSKILASSSYVLICSLFRTKNAVIESSSSSSESIFDSEPGSYNSDLDGIKSDIDLVKEQVKTCQQRHWNKTQKMTRLDKKDI